MNHSTSIIKLKDVLAPIISSREIISEILEKRITEQDEVNVTLDFTSIEFISRSAAHELLKLKEKFENRSSHKKEVIFTNMSDSVAEMVRTVAANRAYPSASKIQFSAEKIDIHELV